MLCPLCGSNVGDVAKLCERCSKGAEASRAAPPPKPPDVAPLPPPVTQAPPEQGAKSVVQEEQSPEDATEEVIYGGFLLRAVAAVFDVSIVFGVMLVVALIGRLKGYDVTQYLGYPAFLGALAYFVLMEASPLRGTAGKLVLGLAVLDDQLQALSFPRVVLRNLGKILSSLIFFLGFLIAAFSERKQTLHDKLVRSVVVVQLVLSPAQLATRSAVMVAFGLSVCLLNVQILHFSFQKIAGVTGMSAGRTAVLTKNSVYGRVTAGTKEIELHSSLALWNRELRRLQIGFFPFELKREDVEQMRLTDSFASTAKARSLPYLTFEMRHRGASETLELRRGDEYQLRVFDETRDQPIEVVRTVAGPSGSTESISGMLNDEGVLDGSLKQDSPLVLPSGETLQFQLEFSARVVTVE